MTYQFVAECNPPDELCAQVSVLAPDNPFYTPGYVNSRRLLGYHPWLLCLYDGRRLLSGCTAFARQGRISRSVEIPSVPELGEDEIYWRSFFRWCHKHRFSTISINSFASKKACIPNFIRPVQRRTRWEYILELQKPELWKHVRKGHNWCINRGRKAGLRVHRSADEKACQEHARLIAASMRRRMDRGEAVSDDVRSAAFAAITQSGAGELYQAFLGGEIVASNLILRARNGAYNHTQGASPEGMECGASHFLIHEIANSLRQESVEHFNLGGTDQKDSGLEKFKSGFGATTIILELQAAEFVLRGSLLSKLTTLLSSFRNNSQVDSGQV